MGSLAGYDAAWVWVYVGPGSLPVLRAGEETRG